MIMFKKGLFLVVLMGMLAFSGIAIAEDNKLLSDTNMESWQNTILFLIIDDMDFLAKTKPANLPEHLLSLKCFPDEVIDKNDIEAALIDMSPKQTHEQSGGDCEDLTIYTVARFLQAKVYYDVGFMLLRNPKSGTQSSQHIVPVILTEDAKIIVYDLSQYKEMKRIPLDQYLLYWNTVVPDFDAYRIWWFFTPNNMQPGIKDIK